METPPNAFTILMTGKRRITQERSATKSSFILCPLGCGKNVAVSSISLHLDQCTTDRDSIKTVKKTMDSSISNYKEARIKSVDMIEISSPTVRSQCYNDDRFQLNESILPPNEKRFRSLTDANRLLMQNSKQFYKKRKLMKQRFHLHDAFGRVTWSTDISVPCENISWESSVMLRQAKDSIGCEQEVDLIISSSIPSFSTIDEPVTTRINLVENKSKLSVPVLKSILQKSIRRKRPLPATKIAMELADKSLGDLLRRLPIIILEDSTLHPHFPFLVWLMVADSKNFIPPLDLINRLMRIIFEIAACNFKDDIPFYSQHQETKDNSHINIRRCVDGPDDHSFPCNMIFASESETDRLNFDHECLLLIRSINLRKHYGGMAGDMQLLDDAVHIWATRFKQVVVHEEICRRLDIGSPVLWKSVPEMIHGKMMEDSNSVSELMHEKIRFLSFHDTVVAGIDFHCSNIIEKLVADSDIFSRVSSYAMLHPLHDAIPSLDDVKSIIRQCMWNNISGINSKRLMSSFKDETQVREYHDLWTEVLRDPHRDYATHYILSRLFPQDEHSH